MRRRQQSELPTSDYLNFIKMNKLKLLERRSSSNPKIFHKGIRYKNSNNPEKDDCFHTLDQHELPTRENIRNMNYEMHYKAHVGQPIFNKLQQIKSEHIKIEQSAEDKAKKISKLIRQSYQIEQQRRRLEVRCSTKKQKSLDNKSIMALATIQKSSGEIKFPAIKKLSAKMNLSSNNSRQKLYDKVINQRAQNYLELSQRVISKKKISSKPEHQKIIQTFYEYERLLKQKQMVINGIPPIRQVSKQDDALVLKPLRKRLKTEVFEQNDQTIELRQIKQDALEQRESKDLFPIKKTTKKSMITVHKSISQTPIHNSDQILLNPTKLIRKKINEAREQTVYDMKLKNYKQFVFQLNFSHNRFDPFLIKDEVVKPDHRYKVYIGRGNNNWLIRQLLKRRHWWNFEDDPSKCQFIWSQIKINSIFEMQQSVEKSENERLIEVKQSKAKSKVKRKVKRQIESYKTKNKNKPEMKVGIQKVFDEVDVEIYNRFLEKQQEESKNLEMDQKVKLIDKRLIVVSNKEQSKLHNHLEENYHIGNKKALFYNMRQYCGLIGKNVFEYLPLTYHIKSGFRDKQYIALVKQFKKRESDRKLSKKGPKNIWIVKPGQISNRGSGITVVNNIADLNKALREKEKHSNGSEKTYIVQSYLDKPLLYNKRKFDIRHYMLITSLYGQIKAYWYSQGYIRTSSEEFDLQDLKNSMIHLTNDAIQKQGYAYGQYEEGNKLSYNDLQRYLDNTYPEKKVNFYDQIYPRMKQIATHAVEATYMKLNPRRLQHGFEVLGLDFMIDQNFDVWMIEVNTNPCLEISSQLLGRIIPNMIEQTLRLTLDVVFPPLSQHPNTQKHLFPDYSLDHLKFQLIFDEQKDGQRLREIYKNAEEIDCGEIEDMDQVFENQGDQNVSNIQELL